MIAWDNVLFLIYMLPLLLYSCTCVGGIAMKQYCIYGHHFIADLLLSVSVKDFRKSVGSWWSGHKNLAACFFDHEMESVVKSVTCVPLSDEGITDVDTYRDCLRTLHSQAVVEAKTNFVPNRVIGASPPDISPLESLLPRSVRTTRSVAFWSLSAFEQLQGPHHQRHIRCLSGVWSGTTLRSTSLQLSRPSDATYSGTTRLRSQTSSTWTTDDRSRAAGLSQQQQLVQCRAVFITWTKWMLAMALPWWRTWHLTMHQTIG